MNYTIHKIQGAGPGVRTPVRTKPSVSPTPVRRYKPDQVCPGQKEETVRIIRGA